MKEKSHNLAYNIQTKGRPNDQEECQLMNNDNDNTNGNQIAPDWGANWRQWEASLITAKGILNLEKPFIYMKRTMIKALTTTDSYSIQVLLVQDFQRPTARLVPGPAEKMCNCGKLNRSIYGIFRTLWATLVPHGMVFSILQSRSNQIMLLRLLLSGWQHFLKSLITLLNFVCLYKLP